jgi:hypothetical protein
MDLDSFFADYRKFKARVLPMVEEWERGNIEPEMSDELKAEIFAPLPVEAQAAQSRRTGPPPEESVDSVTGTADDQGKFAQVDTTSDPDTRVPGALET